MVEIHDLSGRNARKKLPYPPEALPDCESCEKPELSAENAEVVRVFNNVFHDANYNAFSGTRIGLRFESVASAIEWSDAAGWITDRDRVMRRIWILDRIFTKHFNEKKASK